MLAVLSRGDALVLAALLALAVWRPVPALAVGAALVASSWRWGSTSLEALAGAQAVLGPAGWVAPRSAATASWLAAMAVVLAATRPLDEVGGTEGSLRPSHAPKVRRFRGWGHRGVAATLPCPEPLVPTSGPAAYAQGRSRAPNLVLVIAAGATAAAIVAGPAPGGDVWVRVVAAVIGTALAFVLSWLRARRRRVGWALDGLAVAAGAAALAAVAQQAPAWAGTIDDEAVGEGIALAAAVVALVSAATAGWSAMRDRRP